MNRLSSTVPTSVLLIVLVLLTVSAAVAGGGIQGPFAPDQLVCKLRPGISIETINSEYRTTVHRYVPSTGCWLLRTPPGADAESLAVAINSDQHVTFCDPNYYLSAPEGLQRSSPFVDQQVTGEFEEQAASSTLLLPTVHTLSTGSDVRVALIDGGVNFDHPIFEPSGKNTGKLVARYDYIDGDSLPFDEPGGSCSGHGTLIAGVIHLVAPDAEIYVYRVLDTTGVGDGYSVAEAVLQAAEDGCEVVNLSLGMTGLNPALDEALKVLRQHSITVVASAGNDSTDASIAFPFPANRGYCHAVAALDSVNKKADFSNYGPKVDLCAPGEWIYGPFLDTTYAWWDGTSFAAPFVTGTVALLRSLDPSISLAGVDTALMRSAINIHAINPGFEGLLGRGLVNPLGALKVAKPDQRGDANGDGAIDISDIVHIVGYMFQGGSAVSAWADGDCDNQISIADVIWLVDYIFAGEVGECGA